MDDIIIYFILKNIIKKNDDDTFLLDYNKLIKHNFILCRNEKKEWYIFNKNQIISPKFIYFIIDKNIKITNKSFRYLNKEYNNYNLNWFTSYNGL